MLKKQLEATQQNNRHTFPRLKFISNFQLYHGLSKFYTKISLDRAESKRKDGEVVNRNDTTE